MNELTKKALVNIFQFAIQYPGSGNGVQVLTAMCYVRVHCSDYCHELLNKLCETGDAKPYDLGLELALSLIEGESPGLH